uniref:triacylglycerol lipase n=1 Tax=Aceria tosichella TaxID=561515 RepID=A0A6G1S6R6_9ACAR
MGGKHHKSHHRQHHQKQVKSRQTKISSNINKSRQVKNSRESVKDQLQENLSFCGCGFLGIYHVGVASCFHEYAPQLSMHKISGSSAGALVAVAHICGNLQLAYATTDILRVAIEARARALGPLHPSFDINAIVRDALQRGLPDDVHLKVSGKLHISLTRLDDLENVIVSKFDSKEDVIQALICSCFIPCWSGFVPPKYKGTAYIDGGFSNNLLILDDKTVTVSPFAGEADICPRDDVCNSLSICIANTSLSVTPHNLYRLSHALIPPPPEYLSDLCEQGFADGIRFLQRMKLISCRRCLEIRSTPNPMVLTNETTEIIEQSSTTATFSVASCQTRQNSRDSLPSYDSYSNIAASVHHSSTSSLNYGVEMETEEFLFDEEEKDDCDGCISRRLKALRDPLPKLFTDRIREACDNVNESLYNWFYSHRPIKYLSYLAAPYYLPMNISLALLFKYWQQLPYIGLELFKFFFLDAKDFLLEIARRYYERSTTSLLISADDEKLLKRQSSESSISVKITTDCRQNSMRSLTTYECCLTIVLFGRQSLLSAQK